MSNSNTETFAALKLSIDNWRWAGVPFYVRTGKRMAGKHSEIVVQFKKAPFMLFRETAIERLTTNRIVIGGMFVVNFATLLHLGRQLSLGLDPSTLPIAQHWSSLVAAFLYFPGLVALWFVKAPRWNLALLIFMIALLLIGAVGSTFSPMS